MTRQSSAGLGVRRAPRRTPFAVVAVVVCALALPSVLGAQVAPPAADGGRPTQAVAATPLPGPAVRRIASAQAVSAEVLGAITNVRHLPDGRILLNDGARRRLLMLDSTLQQVTVVLDSLTEVENAYGTGAGTLLPYVGDSSVFIDPATLAMLILDGTGRIARVRAVPRAQDINWITNPSLQYGVPAFDASGRFVYRIAARTAPPTVAPPPGMPYFPTPPDSAFLVAVRLDSRAVDTLGVVRIPKVAYSARMEPEGYYNINQVPNPLPLLDDWALLSDGTLAFVRGVDYRVEYRLADGTTTSSEKLPFPWIRMTEDDKTRFTDSAKVVQVSRAQKDFATQMIAWSNLLNKPYPASFVVPPDYVPPSGLPADWILPKGLAFPANYVAACARGVTPPSGRAPAAVATPKCAETYFSEMYGNGYTPPAPIYRAPTLVRPRDLPDYKPPFGASATRADADGRLWIRTIPMRPTPGGVVYDVISRDGELIDRIQLPGGFQLVGFGAGKIVYLSNRDAGGLHLSRVRLNK